MLALGAPGRRTFALPDPGHRRRLRTRRARPVPRWSQRPICNHCPTSSTSRLGSPSWAETSPIRVWQWSPFPATTSPPTRRTADQMVAEAHRPAGHSRISTRDPRRRPNFFGRLHARHLSVRRPATRLVYRGQLDDSRHRNGLPVTAAGVRQRLTPIRRPTGRCSGAAVDRFGDSGLTDARGRRR